MSRRNVSGITYGLIAVLVIGSFAIEVAAKTKDEKRGVVVKTKKGLAFESGNGDYSLVLGGRYQYDYNQFDGVINTNESAKDSDVFVRRARAKIDARSPDWRFKMSYNLINKGSVDVLFASYQGWGEMFEVSVGRQKEGFGLEYMGSSNRTTAIERSMPSNAFSVGKNVGVRVHGSNDSITYSVGMFKQNLKSGAESLDRAATARFVYRPISKKKKVLHIGAGLSLRDGDFDELSARLGSRGGENNDANKISAEYDRGAIGSRLLVWNFESAAIVGPYHVAAEYFAGELTGRDAAPNLEGSGYSVQAGWVLTGETRRYKKKSASLAEISPKGAAGAWEMFARYDTLDVSDSPGGRLTDIDGGAGRTMTLGMNWYWDRYFKVSANFVRAQTDETFGGRDDGNAIAVRLQLAY